MSRTARERAGRSRSRRSPPRSAPGHGRQSAGAAAAGVLLVRHLPARQPRGGGPLADIARVFIANAELDYADGWDYETTFTWLAANQAASAADFARQEVSIWNAHHSSLDEDVLFKSHMALDMSALGAFTTSMSALVATAKTSAGVPSVARVFDMALPDYYMESLDASSAPIPLKDLGQILSSLAQNPAAPVAAAAAAARSSLNAMVLARAMGAARGGQAGLSIGAGIPIAFTSPMSALYRQLVPTWNGGTRWADLIDLVRGGADNTGPAISSTGLANNSIPFRIDDMDLLSVDVNSFTFSADKSRLIFLQLFRRDYIAPGAYQFNWTGKAFAVAATPSPVLVTLLPWREIADANGVQIPISRRAGCCSRRDGRSTPSCWSTSRTSGRTPRSSPSTGCPTCFRSRRCRGRA